MSRAYYNEHDPYAAQWLRNLVAAGEIAPGDVDERDIRDVRTDDLRGYSQCHFFAGIGGWSIALRLAGWPDDRPVWTGSCPCQPFSAAGAGKAADDERHLWPSWFPLIAECGPPVVFGEQVEAAIGWGWLDAVFADLEAEGYACGAAVLPACGVGAPHIRQRLWFVADALRSRAGAGAEPPATHQGPGGTRRRRSAEPRHDGEHGRGLANAEGERGRLPVRPGRQQNPEPERSRSARDVADAAVSGRAARQGRPAGANGRPAPEPRRLRDARGMGDASGAGSGRHGGAVLGPEGEGAGERCRAGRLADEPIAAGLLGGFWSDAILLPCADGKARPVEPGSFPLAHGVLARPSKLRAYGNAIVPQQAAEVIAAFMAE